jgi:hypothetical protein
MRIPLVQLVIGPEHPSGCDSDHVVALADGRVVDDRPIEVRMLCTGCERYEILNGRHRYLAALIRGEEAVECVITR